MKKFLRNQQQIFNIILGTVIIMFYVSCEGPAGLPGEDANESCKECHKPDVVDFVIEQYKLSKHARGEAAFEETGVATCAPCHESTGFRYVCANNTSTTFVLNAETGKYSNSYTSNDSNAYGEFSCNTCHSNIHKNYDTTDFYPLTTTAPVAMTMWGGTKTIDISQYSGKSNLCIKCHQPRPLATSTTLSDGNIVDYADLAANPNEIYYDSAVGNAKPNKLVPGYRTHIHYGSVGAIFAGQGGVEFSGSISPYSNSKHTTVASCTNCHMAPISGSGGGHMFKAKGNFKGCNVSGCHSEEPQSVNALRFKETQAAVKLLLETLASKLTSGGVEMLHTNSDATANMWVGVTSKNYDGYLNIYDPSTNPGGVFQNPAASKAWTTAQKSTNESLPKFTSLKKVQLGAIINFQLCLRDYSLGVHNSAYTKTLLTNSIDALAAAGL